MTMTSKKRSSLPTHCRGVLTDDAGRWLLVHNRNSPWWNMPGGVQEDYESPREAVEREVSTELGVRLRVGNREPLLTAWTWPRPQQRRGGYAYVFDFGLHDAHALDGRIRLQIEEIAEHSWFEPGKALRIMLPAQAERMIAVQRGQHYLEQHPCDLTLRPTEDREDHYTRLADRPAANQRPEEGR
jgi:8-oxo-dGTP pyrophosphatase MutT (NUDIX family)